jgi:hypothetical protein
MYKQRGNVEAEMGILMLVLIFFGIAILSFSRHIGADFLVTATACAKTAAAFLVFCGAMYFLSLAGFFEGVLLFLAVSWFFWWPVLNNVAEKLVPTFLWDSEGVVLPWWDTGAMKWGIELAILGGLAALYYYKNNYRYSRY